ncbi:MAG: tetratricopeptide repeat protein [Candidatus Cloacimonetes bacterium]|nr:tetratricopeptide repeat protein [Candidatus Cloacimonadota bacterium]
MKNWLKILLLFILFVLNFTLWANNTRIDSLKNLISQKKGKEKLDIQFELANLYRNNNDSLMISNLNDVLISAQNISYIYMESEVLKTFGDYYYDSSNFSQSKQYYIKANEKKIQLNDYRCIAYIQNALGNILLIESDYEESLEHYLTSLKYNKMSGSKNRICITLNNIGNLYCEIEKYDDALDSYEKALIMSEKLEDHRTTALLYSNIGVIYNKMDKLEKALSYQQKALKINTEHNIQKGIASTLNNIGNLYIKNNNQQKALEYYLKSMKIKEESNDLKGLIYPLINIANIYQDQKKYDVAIQYLNRALSLSKKINSKELCKNVYFSLSEIYKVKKDFQKALDSFQLYSAIKDSLQKKKASKEIEEILWQYKNEKQEKELEILKLKSINQQVIRYRLYFGIFILAVLSIISYYSYFQKSKANKLLKVEIKVRKNLQRELTEARNELELKIRHRTRELAHTNKELKEEIVDHRKTNDILERYAFIANNSKDFMTLINRDYKYEVVNTAYAEAMGIDKFEIIEKKVETIWGKKDFQETIKHHLEKSFSGKEVHYLKWFTFSKERRKCFDVAYYPYRNANGKITHLVVVTRDITEQKEMEERLVQTERLAELGEMAARVAHEIRNPITIMKSSAQLYQKKFNSLSEERLKKIMEIFVETSDRIDKTITELLEYTKPKIGNFVKVNFVNILQEVIDFTKEKCELFQIKVKYTHSANEIFLKMDEDEIFKAILNLILNSIEALSNGGEIIIDLTKTEEKTILLIKDNGKGISQNELSKIFNPFFTTKKIGTGLGLSIVYKTIKNHSGNIEVQSDINTGTTFCITF